MPPKIIFWVLTFNTFKAMSNSSHQKASVFVSDNHFHPRTDDKHASLLRKTAIYGQKFFNNIWPRFQKFVHPKPEKVILVPMVKTGPGP
jgi:hypothetical protein